MNNPAQIALVLAWIGVIVSITSLWVAYQVKNT
jgi:hypothetical protein